MSHDRHRIQTFMVKPMTLIDGIMAEAALVLKCSITICPSGEGDIEQEYFPPESKHSRNRLFNVTHWVLS